MRTVGWIWAGSPEGARQVLSTIAGSMITVAGVAFSITIVALTLASTQFGPRLLRNFVRDFGSQVVLGTFVSTFVYCLLVLRTVRGGDSTEFVPYLSVTLGLAFALASLGVLIYFIHHIASAIQAEHLIASVADELETAIRQMFPEKLSEPAAEVAAVGGQVRRAENRTCLRGHAVRVVEDARAALVNESDLREIEERYAATLRALADAGDG